MAEPSVTPTHKMCPKCGQDKPIAAFNRDRSHRSGYKSRCSECVNSARRIGLPRNASSPDLHATNKTCATCGETKPIESFRPSGKGYRPGHRRFQCRQCEHLANQPWRMANKESLKLKRHLKYLETKDANAERCKAWKSANAVEWAAYMKAWKEAHAEEVSIYNHDWLQANKLSSAHRQSQRAARKRGLLDTFTYEQEQFCRQYFHYACAYCQKEEGFLWCIAMDHFIPLDSPLCPGTIVTNMLPACNGRDGCNTSKKNRDPHTWLIRKVGKRKAEVTLRKIEAYFTVVRTRFPND